MVICRPRVIYLLKKLIMTTDKTAGHNAALSPTRLGLILATFALACAGVLVAVKTWTQPRIEAERDAAFARQLGEVLPQDRYDNNIARDCLLVQDAEALGVDALVPVYRARQQNEPAALVFAPLARGGYGGDIALLVAIYPNGEIAGVRVTAHKETPGLGDQVDQAKSAWLEQFRGLSLAQPPLEKWTVRKDGGEFDGFTGATITPRAVIHALRRLQQYHAVHRDQLYRDASNCPAPH
jgi:Na+-translocating ferredoxin:NAD+ oxidoreductase subunit G